MLPNFIKKTRDNLTFFQSKNSGIRIVFHEDIHEQCVRSTLSIGISNCNKIASAIKNTIKSSNNDRYPFHLLSFCHYGNFNSSVEPNVTNYTIQTFNEENFLKLLPVQLNYVFNPAFHESLFKVQTHYIDEDGYDTGVLYNERRCNSFNGSFYHKLLDANPSDTYPDFETVKEYHQKYYRMDNCVLIIQDKVNHLNVLEIIEDFERSNSMNMSAIPVPDNSYFLSSFNNEYVEIPIPINLEKFKFELMWFARNIKLKKYYALLIINEYLLEIMSSTIKNVIDGECTSFKTKLYKPYVHGFVFHRLPIDKLDKTYILNLVKQIRRSIVNAPINAKKIKQIIKKHWNRKTDAVEKIKVYQFYSDDTVFNGFSEKAIYRTLFRKKKVYWQKIILNYFKKKKHSIMVYIPDATLKETQTLNEIERLNKRKELLSRDDGLKKIESEINRDIRINTDLIKNTIDFQHFENPKPIMQDIILSKLNIKEKQPEYNILNMPIIYKRDDWMSDNDVKFELIFDLKSLPAEYYSILILYTKIIRKLPDYLYMTNFNPKIIYNQLIFCIEVDIEKQGYVGQALDYFLNNMAINEKMMKKGLEAYVYNIDLYGNDQFGIDEFVDLFMTNNQNYCYSSKYMEYQIFKKLLKSINDGNFDELRIKLKNINSVIKTLKSNLNVYLKDFDMISKLSYDDWPILAQNNQIMRENDYCDFSCRIGKQYYISVPEYCNRVLKKYLRLSFTPDSDEDIYCKLMNLYLNIFVFEYTKITTGAHYESVITGSGSNDQVFGIRYSINSGNNLYKIYETHKKMIQNMIINKDYDDNSFELAKRVLIKNLLLRLTNSKRIKNVTLGQVIEAVGQRYLDLFDDQKSSMMIVIPESLKEGIGRFDNIEELNISDIINTTRDTV